MKNSTGNTLIAISLLIVGSGTAQGLKTDFSKPEKDTVILESNNGTKFTVDTDLAQRSEFIAGMLGDIEDESESAIELDQVAEKELERILIYLDQGVQELRTTFEGLSNEELVKEYLPLAQAAEFLGIEEMKGLLGDIANLMQTWDLKLFEDIFKSSEVTHLVKMQIIEQYSMTPWNDTTEDQIEQFLNSQTIELKYRLALIREIIKENTWLVPTLLEKPDIKQEQDLTSESILADIVSSEPYGSKKIALKLHDFLKKFFGEEGYKKFKKGLEKEYGAS